ncbi:MAG: hypothetical protein U5K81_10680 [Trueperaceae bacterium]|nr:hypothetical protein [Trueperaceae bacterium]
MPKLYLGEALGLLGKTLPFIWIRLGSYLLLGLGLLVYFGIIGGVAWLLGQLWAPLGFILFLLAIGGAFGIVRWVTRYYFYLLKAAHTAVMTEFIVYGRGPEGSQVEYGKKQVMERFRDTSIMFAVDVLVDGIVKRIVRTFVRVASILPIPGLDSLGKLLERVALMSSTYVDESILSRAYKQREENVWKVAHDGIVLYAQAWKPIVANAVVLSLISYVEFFLLLIILGLPAVAVGAVFPALGPALGIAVVVGAWMIKLAAADAWSLAATLLAYHRATEGQEPNPEWVAKIENVSDKFKELGQKARDAASSQAPQQGPAPSGGTSSGDAAGPTGSGGPGGAAGAAAAGANPGTGGVDPDAPTEGDGGAGATRRPAGTDPDANADTTDTADSDDTDERDPSQDADDGDDTTRR